MTQFKSDFLRVLEERGFIHQISDPEGLDKKCLEGPITAYIGFDATAKSLHVGSLIQIMMLHWLQETGHRPIALMGGGTTMIGDPSGRDETRKILTHEDIEDNIAGIRKSFTPFLDFESGKSTMVNNADWLLKLNLVDFLRTVGPHFSVNQMIQRDSVKLRLEREQHLSFLEFNYMVFQAYDFLELNRRYGCTMQMGGSDQWGNIVSGVDLGRRVDGADLYALTTPLLATASGAKMGKTAAGAVWLNADLVSPYDYWQFWRNCEDADTERFLKLFTTLPLGEIAKIVAGDVNDAKKVLATEATALLHGRAAAEEAAETARATFEEGATSLSLPTETVEPEEWETISGKEWKIGRSAIQILAASKLVKSKSEARRKILEGAIRINDVLITDPNTILLWSDMDPETEAFKVQFGKKRIALVKRID